MISTRDRIAEQNHQEAETLLRPPHLMRARNSNATRKDFCVILPGSKGAPSGPFALNIRAVRVRNAAARLFDFRNETFNESGLWLTTIGLIRCILKFVRHARSPAPLQGRRTRDGTK